MNRNGRIKFKINNYSKIEPISSKIVRALPIILLGGYVHEYTK